MTKTERDNKPTNKEDRKSKTEEDRRLSRELEMSFPASDPEVDPDFGTGG
jgi:hypothetical protein